MKYISKLISFLEIISILAFIIIEKSVWTFALKTYNFIKSLPVFDYINSKLAPVGENVILAIFGLIFLFSKFLSLAAVGLIGSGHFVAGVLVYLATFPIGALSIWFLEMQKDKLMKFAWFKWSYENVMKLLDILQNSAPYKKVKAMTAEYKDWLINYKANLLEIKNNRASYMIKFKKKYKAVSRLVRIKFKHKHKASIDGTME